MPIKNYTTSIPFGRSISEIVTAVVKIGATAVQQRFDGGIPVGIAFKMPIKGSNDLYFELPAKISGVKDSLRRSFPRRHISDDQLRRIAWRIVRDWTLAQIALVEAGAAEPAEVFLPYLMVGDNETLYRAFQRSDYGVKQLVSGMEEK